MNIVILKSITHFKFWVQEFYTLKAKNNRKTYNKICYFPNLPKQILILLSIANVNHGKSSYLFEKGVTSNKKQRFEIIKFLPYFINNLFILQNYVFTISDPHELRSFVLFCFVLNQDCN